MKINFVKMMVALCVGLLLMNQCTVVEGRVQPGNYDVRFGAVAVSAMMTVMGLRSKGAFVQAKKKKKKKGGPGGMGGTGKTSMIFINIRDGMVHPKGISKMAQDFQQIMATGGLNVGIVGTEGTQMIAVSNSIRDTIEIRKFMTDMKEVLSVDIERQIIPGNHITEEEAQKHGLKMPDRDEDDL